jgi:DNA polymerase-1
MVDCKRLVIIDGHSQIYRALYSRAAAEDSKGSGLVAVRVFFTILSSLLRQLGPDYLVIALDGPRDKLVRRALYPHYKSKRGVLDPHLREQLDTILEICEEIGLPTIEVPGWEADDAIATLVNDYSHDVEVVVVSPDKDLHQILGPNVVIHNPKSGRWMDARVAANKWGVPASQIVEVLCLAGDRTDGVPGARGIGMLRARNLVKKYGTAARAVEYRQQCTPAVCASLEDFDPALGMQLVQLRTDLQLPFELEAMKWNGFQSDLVRSALALEILEGFV